METLLDTQDKAAHATDERQREQTGCAEGGAMTVTVEVPITTKNPTNTREHWAVRAKRVKAQRKATRFCMLGALYPMSEWSRFEPGESRIVTLTRVSPRAMDDDGAIAALKHVRDEVAACLGVDDGDPRVEWGYHQGPRASHEDPHYEVTVMICWGDK